MMNDSVDDFENGSDLISAEEYVGNWNFLPDSVLLHIFQYLSPKELLDAGLICKSWLKLSHNEYLWKDLFYSKFEIDTNINILPGNNSWLQEFKRLTYHTPVVQTEVLKQHVSRVLHVSFAHNGKLFATCSRDTSISVWDSKYPARLKYFENMSLIYWGCTHYSQFNESDTLLLVSGSHIETTCNKLGVIAIFNLQEGFRMHCRIVNTPFDIFGTWFTDHCFLSGALYWWDNLVSASAIWLNKVYPGSSRVPKKSQLYRFYNSNASSISAIMVANCLTSTDKTCCTDGDETEKKNLKQSHDSSTCSNSSASFNDSRSTNNLYSESKANSIEETHPSRNPLEETSGYPNPIYYNQEYRKAEKEWQSNFVWQSDDNMTLYDDISEWTESICGNSSPNSEYEFEYNFKPMESSSSDSEDECETNVEKLLIFSTGTKTFIPHQIGFKKIKPPCFPKKKKARPSLAESVAERKKKKSDTNPQPVTDWLNIRSIDKDLLDKADHLIDLHGRIMGMGLSPDHRYLYVNNRPWPQGYVIENPFDPPPIAEEIDIHVIDLVTFKEVGTMLRAHKDYTPNDECLSIFLNVCNEYVASGAEEKNGYLWDRHYGICLAKYPHFGVVNSVAFNPRDSEMLVSTSDDCSIKIWRSKHRVKQLKIQNGIYLPKGLEIPLKCEENF